MHKFLASSLAALVLAASASTAAYADEVKIKVKKVDLAKRQIDFTLIP